MKKVLSLFAAILLVITIVPFSAFAAEVTDPEVLSVISQLESIDTLQQIQNKRDSYTVKNNHYDTGTTNEAVIIEHDTARAGYEAYVSEMFAARIAAKQAYAALTDAQKAQIDQSLVDKLSEYLPDTYTTGTFPVTPRNDAYTFEAVNGGTGYAYEVSHHMVSGNIPQTFVLVNTADGRTSWTSGEEYVCGESDFEVAYCCDIETSLEYGTDYKRVNLEDSGYYGSSASQHIRAILMNSYPYVSMEEMKDNLKEGGLSASFVDSLTRSDLISAVQMAVWTYANASDGASEGLGYFASISTLKNIGIYFTQMHDFTNECWDWLPGKRQRSYDARAAYRVNTLAYYLCNLEGVAAEEDQIVISDIEVTRAELIRGTDDTYRVGMYIYLNNTGREGDDLKVTVTSFSENEDGSVTVTNKNAQEVGERDKLEMSVRANSGDTIRVTVTGTQKLAKGVYFYEPEGGRGSSQSLVGIGSGETNVSAEKEFRFVEDMGEMGLRIYKTELGSGSPLSDITFSIYEVITEEGDTISETPTEEELAKYKTDENKVASVTTDVTGYAGITLDSGTYLITEEFNEEKVKAPITPFYLMIPMSETVESDDGTVITETVNIVSIYPKNETVPPPEEPPVIPPTPDNVTGSFEILKYDEADETILLKGAQFEVYRPATSADTDTVTIQCDGIQYAVVPVMFNGEKLVLTTDEEGRASSPEMSCGTYFLVEAKAPAGYNLPEEAFSVMVVSSVMTTQVTVEVANQRGSILPETGGAGTRLFCIIGGALTLGAVILLVTKRRMTFAEQDE